MVNYRLVLIAFLLLISQSIIVHAIEVKDLYVAKVPVDSQSRKDRNTALKEALQTVLVKVGGQASVLTHPDIKGQLVKYNSYVTNYSYERDGKQQRLKATFDSAKINQVFVNANLPIWGSLRPKVVLWLIDEQGLTRNLVSHSADNILVKSVLDFVQQRGLPIEIPQVSALNSDVTTSDIWGRFKTPVFYASKSYSPEAIVIMRLSDNTLLSEEQVEFANSCQLICQPGVALDWSFISAEDVDDTQQFSERYYGVDRQMLLHDALGDIADDIYHDYALSTEENNYFELDIANVETLASYVNITRFLTELSSVKSVKLVHAIGSVRRFNLTLLGSKQALLASLKLHRALRQNIDPLDPSTQQGVPVFYWEQP